MCFSLGGRCTLYIRILKNIDKIAHSVSAESSELYCIILKLRRSCNVLNYNLLNAVARD